MIIRGYIGLKTVYSIGGYEISLTSKEFAKGAISFLVPDIPMPSPLSPPLQMQYRYIILLTTPSPSAQV